MFAPRSFQQGSSVSHWDTSLSPDELMEPSATPTSDDRSTVQLLKDIGWRIFEGPGQVAFTANNYNVVEDRRQADIAISRSGGFDGAISVTVTSADITALAGSDYTPVNEIVSWADGEFDIRTVTAPIVDDGLSERPDETVRIILSNPTGSATITGPSSATLTITDPQDDDFLLLIIPAISAAVKTKANAPQ